jgi:RNA polymerase sigma factor (sigma-70 family)
MPAEDELLAIRCQLGERDAFDALVARWHEPVWMYARRVAGSADAADDLVQDVWIRVLRGLPRLKDPARLRAWIFGIARRVLMDRFRQQYSSPLIADVDIANLGAPDAGDTLADDLADMLDRLADLPVVERDVLALFYLQELSMNEMADVLAVPVGTIKSRLHRARRMLHARMLHAQKNEGSSR